MLSAPGQPGADTLGGPTAVHPQRIGGSRGRPTPRCADSRRVAQLRGVRRTVAGPRRADLCPITRGGVILPSLPIQKSGLPPLPNPHAQGRQGRIFAPRYTHIYNSEPHEHRPAHTARVRSGEARRMQRAKVTCVTASIAAPGAAREQFSRRSYKKRSGHCQKLSSDALRRSC